MSSIVGPAGSVDPELLRSRLSGIADENWRRQVSGVVEGALACVRQFHTIDFIALEREAPHIASGALWPQVEGGVKAIWKSLEGLQAAMKPLIDEHEAKHKPAQPAPTGDPLEDEFVVDLDSKTDPAIILKHAPSPEERVCETAWAMSFVLAGELEAFRRRLPALLKLPDGWELVTAVQDHVGHVRSAVNAIAGGIFTSLPGGTVGTKEVKDRDDLELVVSRELRSRLFQLRDDLGALEAKLKGTPPAGWHDLLVRAQYLVDEFMFSPAFAWMRAGDKRSFLTHQRSLVDILALWSPLRAEPARRAIENVARYLEALEVINQRECLVVHDRDALKRVVDNLTLADERKGAEGREATGRGLAALAEAQGRDRELDQLLAQTLDPGAPVPTERIRARASEVLRSLGG